MKSKLLPLSLFTLILGVASIILAGGLTGEPAVPQNDSTVATKNAADYLNKIRRNQVTLRVNPNDELQAHATANAMMALKAGSEVNLNWKSMGPDNAPGVVRAMLFDNKASNNSLILASITGGIWRTTNQGATWTKLNQANQNLKVTSMVQDNDGNIYAGTGDAFCTDNVQYAQNNLYYSGIVGTGVYKSTDQDNFTLLPATQPQVTQANDTVDWAYVYDMEYDAANDRVYTATNTGLFFTNDKGTTWQKVTRYETDSITYGVNIQVDTTKMVNSWYIDEITGQLVIEGLKKTIIDTLLYNKNEIARINAEKTFGKIKCDAVDVGPNGNLIASFNNIVYVSDGGADPVFRNISGNPKNFDMFAREDKNFTTNLIVIDTNNQIYNRGAINYNVVTPWDNLKVPESPYSTATNGRSQVAIAPTDENVMYVTSTVSNGFMENFYLSTDKGLTWKVIFPGGASSTMKVFDGTACYNSVITVFPNDPYRVLLGGDNLWYGKKTPYGGFYDWGAGAISSGAFPGFDNYLPYYHHDYVFFPNNNNKFAIATNQGIAFGNFSQNAVEYTQIIRGLSTAQVYTLGISGRKHTFLAGVHGNGVQYVTGNGNTPETGERVYGGIGSSGGSAKVSLIYPAAFMVSDSRGNLARTGDKGESFSLNFSPPTTNLFITPFALWESFNDYGSKFYTKFIADRTYYQGETLLVRSVNKGFEGDKGYPFYYVLDQDSLVAGDSISVKDIVQSKLFIANHSAVYMTNDFIKFDSTIKFNPVYEERSNIWKVLQTTGNFSKPSCMALSSDANHLFVGTENGLIYRVSNIKDAYDKRSGDIDSPFTVLAVAEIADSAFDGRYITSLSVDQQNPQHIILTLGNYGNENYVYQSMNALASNGTMTFTNITGNLPKAPVYSSVIEMKNSSVGIIGTEFGIYATDNLTDSIPEWSFASKGIGKAMVVKLEQQTTYTDQITLSGPDPLVPPVVYPAVDNYGDIYCATYGRGVFRDDTYHYVGIDDDKYTDPTATSSNLVISPNPVMNEASISYQLDRQSENVTVQVFDITGKVVREFALNNQSRGNNTFSIDCSQMTSGIYMVSVYALGQSFNSKFIVK
ncbi:MAG: T9SS type A sorting domain-containing protein [Bacteroidales bacterium]|nr:T9SS type A sorting domain-containing protein [Bacteroidales bacterium]MDD4740146.1 T9SS type A sorting domain-containing protein [Bacteroidales bacterium]